MSVAAGNDDSNDIADAPPQVQVFVTDGSQYAALAKNVKDLKAEICGKDSVVMDCLLIAVAHADLARRIADVRTRDVRGIMTDNCMEVERLGTSCQFQRGLI